LVHRAIGAEPRDDTVLGTNRLLITLTLLPLLVIGVIISLATDNWWAVVAACAVHAVGTFIVATVALRASMAVEHVAPETAARLQDEGIGDPDQVLTDLVDRNTAAEAGSGPAEVVTSGHNRVTARPDQDPGRAASDQRTAGTPSAARTGPSGAPTGTPMVLPVVAVAGSLLVGIAAARAGGRRRRRDHRRSAGRISRMTALTVS
jgi:hypothetical protein